jgi:hypothetical protein
VYTVTDDGEVTDLYEIEISDSGNKCLDTDNPIETDTLGETDDPVGTDTFDETDKSGDDGDPIPTDGAASDSGGCNTVVPGHNTPAFDVIHSAISFWE